MRDVSLDSSDFLRDEIHTFPTSHNRWELRREAEELGDAVGGLRSAAVRFHPLCKETSQNYTGRDTPPHFFPEHGAGRVPWLRRGPDSARWRGPTDSATRFYGELRSVAGQVVHQLKRQAQERRAEERRRSPADSICGKLRSVAAQAQIFTEASQAQASPPSIWD